MSTLHIIGMVLGAILAINVVLVLVLWLIGEQVRFGAVVSWTRALFGVDYDTGLLAFHFGPVALCIAWSSPENNPFIKQEDLDKL